MCKVQKVLVFGGTTEGRRIYDFLRRHEIAVTLSVATAYGKQVLEADDHVIQGRLTCDQMVVLMREDEFSLVIDATHPYATVATETIQEACQKTATAYVRLARQTMGTQQLIAQQRLWFESDSHAVDYLNTTAGRILLTVGSKEIEAYTRVCDFKERVFVRILPMVDSLQSCLAAGIKNTNIICAQGPFSQEMNEALIKHTNAQYIVTKSTGDVGGFLSKIEAADKLGVTAVIIAAKAEETGKTYAEAIEYVKEMFGIETKRFPFFIRLEDKKVVVVGGGAVSERRVKQLVQFDAAVTVVAPDMTEPLQCLLHEGKIKWHQRPYQASDIEDAFFVVAATNDRQVNRAIGEASKRMNIFVNVADCKEESDVWFPAIAEDDELVVGIVSKNGDHRRVKQVAKKIRDVLYVGDSFEA